MNWNAWIVGLISALVSGVGNAVAVYFVVPESLSWERLGLVALFGAIIGVANYIKQFPIPAKVAAAIIFLFLVIGPSLVFAADVTLKWDASEGAQGYKIYRSDDFGATWDSGIDVGNVTTFVYRNVPEDRTVAFRVSAYKNGVEAVRTWSGAWYDHRLKPAMPPSGTGIQ